MAQNQQYAQYPYYAQPQNIYQQLGKPQPQPHLQSAYQQQQQQQQQLANVPQQQPYQYVYQQQQQQQPQTQPIQRVPSAHGFQQQPQSSFPGAPGYTPHQQMTPQQVYQYTQAGAPAPTPVPQASAMYQRPPSQNSHLPTSSFPNLHHGQSMPDVLTRQPSTGPATSNVNLSGQLVPTSQSLTLRGPSPAMPSVSPRPPISPSAVFAQQVQQQRQQQVPSMALVPANRNSMLVPVQRQPVVFPPQTQPQMRPPPQVQAQLHSQSQPQPQPQSQQQPQTQPQIQHQPLPPVQTQIQHQGTQIVQHQGQAQRFSQQLPQQHPTQQQGFQPTKPSQRRPLPSPGASRPFSSVSAAVATINNIPPSSTVNVPPARSNFAQRQVATTTSQPPSPVKSGTSSPTKAPSSPSKSRPLPTPGGSNESSNFTNNSINNHTNTNSPAKEGFAGIGTTRSSARVTGLPVPSNITSLVAGIKPESLTILPLPEGSTGPENDDQGILRAGTDTVGDSPGKRAGSPAKAASSNEGFVGQRRAASPPRFQPGVTSSPSPTKEIPSPSLPPTSSSQAGSQLITNSSSTKKFTPVWKRTIPDYPQPAFGYAAGMVADPFAPSARPPPGSSSSSPPKATNAKPNQTEKERQRAAVERELVERQLQTAMAQAHAQAQVQKAQPISNTSYSAYAMYSQSNPNLYQQSSRHVRSGAHADYEDDDEDDDDGDSDSDEDEEEETEEAEEEKEFRRHRHGKKASESTVTGGKAKKKKVVKVKQDERKGVKKTKSTPASRSASAPPKKRVPRNYVSSTSEDETEATELTGEEGETEEEAYRRTTRHVKSSSASSSRFKAKVEKEILKKRRLSLYDHPDEYDIHDDDAPRKRDQGPSKKKGLPPTQVASQRQSYHQRSPSSGFGLRGSPSPPPDDRVLRRASPPRVTLLKDAQRRTIKLRDDDDDGADGGGRGRREEVENWKRDERYRSRERGQEEYATEPSKRRFNNSQTTHYGGDHEYSRVQERDLRHSLIDTPSRQFFGNSNGPRQHPATTIRDTDERRERWARGGRYDEQDPSTRIFNPNRQDSPTRHPVRDSVFATGYRSRPASPTRNSQRQQHPNRDSTPTSPLMSPYRSRPSSPTRLADVSDNGLVTKFSVMNVRDAEREAGRRGQGQWPADSTPSRTPGQMSNHPNDDYFDAADGDTGHRTGPQVPTEFARISGRVATTNDQSSSYGKFAKPSRIAHNPHHHSNLNMNLDDPPPRSLSPAISQGSSAYGRNSESPQQLQYQYQPQPFNDRRPQSEVYASPMTNNSMQRRKSFYGDMSSSAPEPPSPMRQGPQSQVYTTQAQAPLPRSQSIHPFDRANMNKTNINNGTPKTQTIDIESPAPVGGREKRADLDRMMSDPEDDDFTTTTPRINVSGGFNEARNQSEGSTRAPMIQVDKPRGPMIQVDPPRGPMIQIDSPRGPVVNVESPQRSAINVEPPSQGNYDSYTVPRVQVYEIPGISVAGLEHDDRPDSQRSSYANAQRANTHPKPNGRGGLICGGCDGPIIGRIVSAMGARWHPQCFKCTVCGQLLEHVSSYEHDGRPYCHLDYHENFAPRCFSCKTAIIEERFISLDDPALGKRTYHEQHFFCAECGDPFLTPSIVNSSRTGELNVKGDGEFESDDVGFTVYKGHPYCEACHVRLRLPKCKKCKKSIRDHERAVEALGGKWCWGCFVCASCERPFENPSFFQRGDKPFCERCFDIMLRNEI